MFEHLDDESIELIGGRPTGSDALDKPLTITFFKNRFASAKSEDALTLRDFAGRIRRERKKSKRSLPFFKLAVFGNKASPKNCLRYDANVRSVAGVEGDYDAEKMTIDEACESLRAAEIAALLYETATSTADFPKWRVIAPFSQSLPPSEREKHLARLNGVLTGYSLARATVLLLPVSLESLFRGSKWLMVDISTSLMTWTLQRSAKAQEKVAPRRAEETRG
jgi:hypothetical protein